MTLYKKKCLLHEMARFGPKLRTAGCYLNREGKSHSLCFNPKNGIIEAVPHNEIKEALARKILENLNAE